MKKKRETTLMRFLKDECANFDKYYQSCLFADSCLVLDGKRCGYFERAVLGPPDNRRQRLPGYDYQKLFAQYAEQTKAEKQQVKVRRCECGAVLGYHRRYCDDCRKAKAKEANRKRQRNHRLSNVST